LQHCKPDPRISHSIAIDGKTYKPTIFAIQAQASYAKSIIFLAEARVAIRANNYIWAAIASYYSLFHLANSLMFMSPQLIEPRLLARLVKKRADGTDDPTSLIPHSYLPRFLSDCELHGLTPRLRELLEIAKDIREESANYGPRIVWRGETPTFLTHRFRPSNVRRITISIVPLLSKALIWARKQHSSSHIVLIAVAVSLDWFLQNRDLHYAKWCSKEVLAEAEALKCKLPLWQTNKA